MRAFAFPLSLMTLATAENGDHSLYRYAGSFGGYHWMSESQPTTNNCTRIEPGFVQSEYCGPGHFRADQENVELTERGFKLTATAPTDPLQVTNAQLYLCSGEGCANAEGTTDMPTAVSNQQTLGPGTFVFHIDNFTTSQGDGKFPSQIVLGLYLYKPNMRIQGNVDCHDELDIEYAGWGGKSTVGVTTWPSPSSGIGYSEETNSGIRSEDIVPGCTAIRWVGGTSVKYALWKPVDGACKPEDCFDRPDSCTIMEHKQGVPINQMVPAINLWWFGGSKAVAIDQSISVIIRDFQYLPEEPTPVPTPMPAPPAPTPVPTPAPTPVVRPACCWSTWGDETTCGNRPEGASGGRCNTDWSKNCFSDSDCAAMLV